MKDETGGKEKGKVGESGVGGAGRIPREEGVKGCG